MRLADPKTNIEYVVLPAEIFDQMQNFFDDAPLTDAEKRNLLVSTGLRAGWDDAEIMKIRRGEVLIVGGAFLWLGRRSDLANARIRAAD